MPIAYKMTAVNLVQGTLIAHNTNFYFVQLVPVALMFGAADTCGSRVYV